jgi:hypothetical protein
MRWKFRERRKVLLNIAAVKLKGSLSGRQRMQIIRRWLMFYVSEAQFYVQVGMNEM